jgi:integrase
MSRRSSPYVLDAVEEFLRTKAAREKATLRSYSSILLGAERGFRKTLGQPFAVFFRNRKCDSLSHDDVAIWFSQRVDGGAQNTKHRISKGARNFLTWAYRRGYTSVDLSSAIDPFRSGQGRLDWLTFDEIHRLLSAIPEERYRFAARWLFYTGARVGEATRARHRDIRWRPELDTYEWQVPETKTHHARTVLLPDELATAYQAVVKANAPRPDWPILWDSIGRGFARAENPAFPISAATINAALERARASVGLTIPVTAHIARHSFCTNWVHSQGRDDFSVERLSRQVGTSASVLRRTYIHFDLKPDDLVAIKDFGKRRAR